MENNQDKSKDDKKLDFDEALKIVKDSKKELSDYRKPLESDWKKYDNAYYGKQNKYGEDVKTVKNHVFKLIEQQIPLLTDSMPSTQITASKEEKQEVAENLGKAIKFVHQDQNLPLLLPSLLRSGLMSAPGYLYAWFNPDADCGEGKIEYAQIPWKSVFMDGNVSVIEQSEKFRFELNKRKDSLARTWPEFAEEIKELQSSDTRGTDDDGLEKRDQSGPDAIAGKVHTYRAKDILVYTETWVKDYSLVDIDQEESAQDITKERQQLGSKEAPEIQKWEDHKAHKADHMAQRGELLQVIGLPPDARFEDAQAMVEQIIQQNPQAAEQLGDGLLIVKMIDNHLEEHDEFEKLNPTSQAPKYDDGWRVIKSINEKIIVYDGPNPEKNGMIPIIPFYGYKDDTIYGFGEVKNILNAQQTLNDVDFREFEGLKLCSNPGWLVDHEAEVTESQLTNKPGLVVKKKRGTEVQRFPAGQISPQLDLRKQLDQQSMESIAGLNEQTMNGALPSGNASGAMVQRVQTQAIGRIRLKGRVLEYYSMRRLALITANLIENHWTQEKRLRLRADDNSIEEIVYNPLDMEELEYMIDVTPGSMAGVDKDALITFYLMLLNNQHITFEMFLAACPEFPGKHILIKQTKENNIQAQQIQQAQQQYEQTIQQQQMQMQQIQAQNIKLKGAHDLKRQASIDLLSPEEKKIFENLNKEDQINQLGSEQVNMEPMMANQDNQGM